PLLVREIRNLRKPGGTSYDLYAVVGVHDYVLHSLLFADEVVQIVFRNNPQDDIDIGKAKVRIHENYFLAELRVCEGKIRRKIGLSHAALSAGNRNNPGTRSAYLGILFHNLSERFSLVCHF